MKLKNIIHITLIFSMLSCNSYNSIYTSEQKREINNLCKECKEYVVNELRPQLIKCHAYDSKNNFYNKDGCDFDENKLGHMASCFIGKSKEQIEKIVGTNKSTFYRKTHSGSGGNYINFKYSSSSKRLTSISINNNGININQVCFDCDLLYVKIKNGRRIETSNLETLMDQHGSCFYSKSRDLLNNRIEVDNYQEGDNYTGSFTKALNFKGIKTKVRFIYASGYILDCAEIVD